MQIQPELEPSLPLFITKSRRQSRRLLPRISHSPRGLIFLLDSLRSPGRLLLHLLLLLHQGAAGTAAREDEVGDAIAAEVELFTDLGALHSGRDPVESEAGRGAEEETLRGWGQESLC